MNLPLMQCCNDFAFRSPELFVRDIEYLGLDGEKNLYFTFLKATEFIQSAVEKVNYCFLCTFIQMAKKKFC